MNPQRFFRSFQQNAEIVEQDQEDKLGRKSSFLERVLEHGAVKEPRLHNWLLQHNKNTMSKRVRRVSLLLVQFPLPSPTKRQPHIQIDRRPPVQPLHTLHSNRNRAKLERKTAKKGSFEHQLPLLSTVPTVKAF